MFKGLRLGLGIVCVLLLAACGGGGGGGGGGGDSGGGGTSTVFSCNGASSSTNTTDFSLSTVQVNLAGKNDTAGSDSTIKVNMSNVSSRVASIYIVQNQTWLTVTPNTASGYATVSANAYGLSVGTHCATATVTAYNINGTALSSLVVAVQFDVRKGLTDNSSSSSSSSSGSSSSTSSSSSSSSGGSVSSGTAACTPAGAVPSSTMTDGSSLEIPRSNVNALVYDKGRNVYYATLSPNAPSNPNRIAVISADTGAISYSSNAIGSNPSAMAISADCSTLYVSSYGSNELLRVALPALTVDARVALGSNVSALSLSVSPKSPNTVAVTLYNAYSNYSMDAFLFTNMIRQSQSYNSKLVAFDSTGDWVYGHGQNSSLHKMAVSASGLNISSTNTSTPSSSFLTAVDDLVLVSSTTTNVSGTNTGRAYNSGLASVGALSDNIECSKLPGVSKIVCVKASSGWGATMLTVADSGTFGTLATPSIPNGWYYDLVPGASGQVGLREDSRVILVKNSNFK